MTVGISAICAEGVVVACDRRVSVGTVGAFNYEGGHPKMIAHGGNAIVAASGGLADIKTVIERFKDQTANTIPELAAIVRAARESLRHEYVENQFLKRPLNLDLRKFAEEAKTSTGQLYSNIYTAMKDFKLGLQFLIAGVDQDGPHLFVADESDYAANIGSEGFAAIGSGWLQAQYAIGRRGYTRDCDLSTALFTVYEAKRAAEFADGVGPSTDIAVVRVGKKAKFLRKNAIEALARLYDRLKPPSPSRKDLAAIKKLLG